MNNRKWSFNFHDDSWIVYDGDGNEFGATDSMHDAIAMLRAEQRRQGIEDDPPPQIGYKYFDANSFEKWYRR